MSDILIETKKLPNHLTVVKIHLPEFRSVTNMLAIRSGSRYETKPEAGLAHFLEHLVFKGTKKYKDTNVLAQSIEGIGGYFNAYTGHDQTAYWNVVPKKHVNVGIEMPFELAYAPLLKEEDMKREKGVIFEEIRMIQDDPARYVADLAQQLLYSGHKLGNMIIGSEKSIEEMTMSRINDYRSRMYLPSHSLFVMVGDVKDVDPMGIINNYLPEETEHKLVPHDIVSGYSTTKLNVLEKKTDQTHFMMGVAGPEFSQNSPEKYKVAVMNAVLGEGMSSRLFLNVREKKGLAYSIHSSVEEFEDTGSLIIYGGVNTDKINDALEAIDEELTRLKEEKVSDKEMTKAKQMIAGSLDLAHDSPLKLAKWYGVDRLFGEIESLEEAQKSILAVNSDDVQQMAKKVLTKDKLILAVIGPYKDDSSFKKFLSSSS